MEEYYKEVFHPVYENNIRRLILSKGIRYYYFKGYFIGNELTKVVVDNMTVMIDNETWEIIEINIKGDI